MLARSAPASTDPEASGRSGRHGARWGATNGGATLAGVPTYDFRCRTCDDVFEVRRPMAESDQPAVCPAGHADTVKLLSVFASVGSASPSTSAQPAARPSGGGCCGGACGCG